MPVEVVQHREKACTPRSSAHLRGCRAVSAQDGTRQASRWDLVRDPIVGPLGIAQLVSALGSAMTGLAIVYLSYDRTGSVFRAVLVTAAYTLPAAVFGVWAGRVTQHRSRRQILVTVYSLKMLVYTAMAVLELTVGLTADMMLAISFVSGAISAFSYPAWQAFERDVVAEDQLDRVNAFFSSLTSSADLVGVIAGGVVLGVVGAGAVLVFNALSYIPEIVLLWRLHPKERTTPEGAPKGHELRRAIDAIRSEPVLRRGFVSLVAVSLLAAPIAQLLPGLAHEISGQPHTLGILTAALTLGGVASPPRWLACASATTGGRSSASGSSGCRWPSSASASPTGSSTDRRCTHPCSPRSSSWASP